MEKKSKELKRQSDILLIKQDEIRSIRDKTLDQELSILLNDVTEIIGRHIECLKNKEDNIMAFNDYKISIFQETNNNRKIAKYISEIMENFIELIDRTLKLYKIKDDMKLQLEEIKNKYSYMDSELENYIQRLDNGEF